MPVENEGNSQSPDGDAARSGEADMAKINKINDPAEAALSAIEEALNSKPIKAASVKVRAKATKLPRIDDPQNIATADQISAESDRLVIPEPDMRVEQAAQEASRAKFDAAAEEAAIRAHAAAPASPILAPPATAANDDRRSDALLMAGLQQRPSRMPLVLATLFSLGWLGIVGYYVAQTLDAPITLNGGYFAAANLPTVAGILLAALLPVAFIFTVAVLLRRAQEMRIAARAMTEAALRLAQPEVIASDSVFSLGQAIRREVASMGDGIERAVARASELETLVHSEVSQLERSYADNEMKIRTLLDELAIQREAIGNSASSVRMSIMGAHDNLSTDLQTVAQRITDTVTQAGEQVASALDGKRDMIAHSLKQAGDEMIEQISVRSNEMTERLTATGETVTHRFSQSVDEVNASLNDTGNNLIGSITERAQQVTHTLETTGNTLIETITERTQGVSTALEVTGNSLIHSITERAQGVTTSLETTGNTLIETITERTQGVSSALEATGNSLIHSITERAQGVTTSLETTGNILINTITERTQGVSATLETTGNSLIHSITERAHSVTVSMETTGNQLISSFTERSADVNNTMRATGESLILDLGLRGAEVTQRIEETGTRIADTVTSRGDSLAIRLVETSDRINESIMVHGKGLEDNLAATGQQAASLIAEQVVHAKGAFEGAGQTIVSLFGGQTSRAESVLNEHAEAVRTKLDGHADQVRARLAETGKDIVLAIATQGNRVNEALAENARGLSSTLETHSVRVADKLQNFDETVGQRLVSVETLMTTHGEGLMARLVSYSDTVTQDMQKQVDAFEQAARTRTSALSGSFDELITRVDAGLERRGIQLNEQLSKQAIDIAKIMSEGGRDVTTAMETKASEIDTIIVQRTNAMADSLGSRAEQISQVLNTKASEINQTLGGRAEQISQVLTTKASEINETLGGRATDIADTLDNRIGAFEERVVGRLDAVSNAIDQKGFQFAATLVQRTEAINTAFSQSGESLTATLEFRAAELASRIEKSASEFQGTIVDGAERSISELTGAHQKLTGEIASVLERLNDANSVLGGIVSAAATNLEAVESGLSERVKTLESVMGQIISDTSKTSQRVEKQVALLKEVSGGVLVEAATISDSIHVRGAALARAAEDLNHAQSRLDLALGDKHDDIRSLVSTIGEKSSEIEGTMQRFNELLQESLAAAEQRARDISTTLIGSSENATAAIKEQHDLIRKTTAKENERTSAALRATYEQVIGEMGDVLNKTTDNFRITADQLRSVTGEIAQELEATRAEVSRGTLGMPRDIASQTSSIKRAVGEQLKALSELNSIVERSSLDVAPPQAAIRREAAAERVTARPAPVVARPAPAPRVAEPAPARGGWLSDLLNKASSEPAPAARASKSSTVEQGLESLDVISTDIARLVDAEAVSEVWDRYTRGDRNVFSRRLYTLQGQQTFDEVRRRYRRETEFREAIDRYVEEFERLLKEVAANGRDSSVAQNYLMSDTGKVYTLLAHASGRFE